MVNLLIGISIGLLPSVTVVLTRHVCAAVQSRRNASRATLPCPSFTNDVSGAPEELSFVCEMLAPPAESTKVDYWRYHVEAHKVRMIPTDFLVRLLPNGWEQAIVRSESEKMSELRDDITRYGIRLPLTIVADSVKCSLQDGHHRVIIAKHAAIPMLPCLLQRAKQIKKQSVPLADLVHVVYPDLS